MQGKKNETRVQAAAHDATRMGGKIADGAGEDPLLCLCSFHIHTHTTLCLQGLSMCYVGTLYGKRIDGDAGHRMNLWRLQSNQR
jgi:hypothetical protein